MNCQKLNVIYIHPHVSTVYTASLNLFGDVNRRLEMMITGNKTNCFRNGFKNNFKENMDPTTETDGNHQQFLNEEGQNLVNGEFIDPPFPSVPTGQRRLRRNPRRSNYSTNNHSDTTITSHESKVDSDNGNDRSNVGNSNNPNNNIDLVQPGQMITVSKYYVKCFLKCLEFMCKLRCITSKHTYL